MTADIRKNSRASIRVRMGACEGSRYLDVRVWAQSAAGESVRTQKGLTIPVTSIPALIEALVAVSTEGGAQAA